METWQQILLLAVCVGASALRLRLTSLSIS